MSLDTVLKIGKAFRASTNGLKRFKYVKQCPKDKYKSSIIRLSLPVNEDFSFNFDNITEITDENIIGSETTDSKLYYLTFKTSDSDAMVKYIFGDIFFGLSSTLDKQGKIENKEVGFFKLDNPTHKLKAFQLNSFDRGEEDFKKIISLLNQEEEATENVIMKFRDSFNKHLPQIQSILKYHVGFNRFLNSSNKEISNKDFLNDETLAKELCAKTIFENIRATKTYKKTFALLFQSVDEQEYLWDEVKNNQGRIDRLCQYSNSSIFLHFSFPKKKHWYNFKKEFDTISKKMLDDFVDKSGEDSYVLKKTLYKTLCSGDAKNDIQFPRFEISAKHKSKSFTNEEINDLFYAIDYSKKAAFSPTDDVKLIVLPYGENLTADDYELFFKKMEEQVADRENTKTDLIFSFFDEENEHESLITQFDLIFSKKGGMTSPDTDLIELSGIKKSSLQEVRSRIDAISLEIYEKRKKELKITSELKPLGISWSFTNILGSTQTDSNGKVQFKTNPKYQSHLIRILPQIYSANYFEDNTLLPSFIQNVEFSIRHKDPKFNFLKYDLEFLLSIQNTNIYKQNFNTIMASKSYELGKNIGKLALFLKPDSKGDSLINSFEKEFAGNLSRHIGQLRDVQKFCSYLFEKYALHKEKARYIPSEVRKGTVTKNIEDLLLLMINMEIGYDKHECAFGFFASYFAPYEPKAVETLEEKLDN